jgi:hypothetical protein
MAVVRRARIDAAMAQAMSSPDKWLPVSIAPADMDLEVCVMARDGAHALVFPCRRTDSGWADSATGKLLDIAPTHWRRWQVVR